MRTIVYGLLLTLSFMAPALAQPAVKQEAAPTAVATSVAKDRMLDIQEIKSAGGITAWLVEDHTLPIISIEFSFREAGSARDPQDRQGLARLVSNTMDEGAGDIDSQTFQKALTDNSISLSFSVGRDDFQGSLKTLTRHKDKAFNLMTLALTKPRFDQEAVDRMRAANIARIKSSMTDPGWIAARLQNDLAYQGHAYALNSGGTLTSLAAITPDDLRNFVKNNLTRDRLYIGVSGDITPDELKTVLDSMFGTLPEKATTEKLTDIAVQNIGKSYLFKQDIPQTFITQLQSGIRRDDPDYFAASIMDFILGGSGFGSRLTEEIREKRGLTYGIDSSLFDMDHSTGFVISLSTENKNAGEAIKLIRQEVVRMRDTPVTAKELADAKSYIVGALPLSFSTTQSIASALRGLQVVDYPSDFYDRYPDLIRAVTIQDIERVSKRLLDPDKMLTIVVGQPEGINPTEILTKVPNVE
jgi:zinc protease